MIPYLLKFLSWVRRHHVMLGKLVIDAAVILPLVGGAIGVHDWLASPPPLKDISTTIPECPGGHLSWKDSAFHCITTIPSTAVNGTSTTYMRSDAAPISGMTSGQIAIAGGSSSLLCADLSPDGTIANTGTTCTTTNGILPYYPAAATTSASTITIPGTTGPGWRSVP